jgi:hypothetical protein
MTASSNTRLPSPKTQKMHELYLKRRSQRVSALKKVIKQWHRLQDAEKFFDTLEVWRSCIGDDACVPDRLFDFVTDAINEEENNLNAALDRLAAANKIVYDAIDAMGDRMLYAHRPSAPIETFGECFSTKKTRWPLVFYDDPLPARIEKIPSGKSKSKPALSTNHPELCPKKWCNCVNGSFVRSVASQLNGSRASSPKQ